MREILFAAVVTSAVLALVAVFFKAADYTQTRNQEQWRREEEYRRNGPCSDTSTLIATTAGSPSSVSCENRSHRMRVQPVTRSGEEIGAVVFCECERP